MAFWIRVLLTIRNSFSREVHQLHSYTFLEGGSTIIGCRQAQDTRLLIKYVAKPRGDLYPNLEAVGCAPVFAPSTLLFETRVSERLQDI